MIERNFGFAWVAGIAMVVAMVVFSAIDELPIRDPDSLVPGYIRFPAIVLGAILLDIVPRVLWRARRSPRDLGDDVARGGARALAGVALALRRSAASSAWYLMLRGVPQPQEHGAVHQRPVLGLAVRRDRPRSCGSATTRPRCCTTCFGTGIAAHFFSVVYFVWIALVPVSDRDRPGLHPPHPRRLLVRHRRRLRLGARRGRSTSLLPDGRADLPRPPQRGRSTTLPHHLQHPARRQHAGRPGGRARRPLRARARCRRSRRSPRCTSASW